MKIAIDLTIVTPILEPLMEWLMSSPNDSDHLPVVITIMNHKEQNGENKGRDIKKANWTEYRESDAWKDISLDRDANNEEVLADLYNRFNRTAEHTMPRIAIRKFYPKQF